MKIGFYPKLAVDGIRKNRRMYLPYILTCIGMVVMTYIISYLQDDKTIASMKGGRHMQDIMSLGVYVLTFFSLLFLFYTNSFLMRRRKKEFGLYNILGMDKKNISRIIFWEHVFVAAISLAAGLVGGIALSKLAQVWFVNMMQGEVTYEFVVSWEGILFTAVVFGIIFLLLFFNSLRQLWFSSAMSLLRSENVGERPPRANWFFGLLGIAVLGAAYYLAVTIKDPITALGLFFVAVLMVIVATYLIMIAGSVLLCRILQKNTRFYYQPRHFVSVSSMAYRMKRNGAGLASICILATMVLVILSSTVALFIGGEDIIHNRCPRDLNGMVHIHENKIITEEQKEFFLEKFNEILAEHGTAPDNFLYYRLASVAGLLNEGEVIYDSEDVNHFNIGTYSDVVEIYMIPLEDYNEMTGRQAELAADEALMYCPRDTFLGDTFGFQGGRHYHIKEHLTDCFTIADMMSEIVPSIVLIVPDLAVASEGLLNQAGNELVYRKWIYAFDVSLEKEKHILLKEAIRNVFRDIQLGGNDFFSVSVDCREAEREDFYGTFGGILYLGILLSIVFIIAAVLMIYYKQISEGYEDSARFEIMQKVGMTREDIRQSINSQLLLVFFLPLLLAGIHLAFAFPIIEKLLLLFNMHNRLLFAGTTVSSFLLFALFYVVVYRITSNAYYEIVSG